MPGERKKTRHSLLNLDVNFGIGGTNIVQRSILAKNLAVMLKSGINIVDALYIARDSSVGRMKVVLGRVASSVKAGNTLSSALDLYPRVFTGIFISAVRSGENSGNLDSNLEELSKQLEKEKELLTKIRAAMFYPVVVMIAAFSLAMAVSFFVLPKITPLFEGLRIELPWTTKFLIAFSKFVQQHTVPLFLGIIGAVIFLVWFLRKDFVKPATHLFFLRVPIIKSLVRNSNLASFAHTLVILLRSGLNIDEALDITSGTLGNYYYKNSIKHISVSIGKGTKLWDNLRQYSELYPNMMINMIRVGEETGKMEDTLMYLFNYYMGEVDNDTKALSSAIEPILLAVIGLMVAFLALSIITPIYNITGGVGKQ